MQLHRGTGHPEQHLARRVEAEGLFDPVWNAGGVVEGLGPLVGMTPTPVPGVAEQLGGGLVAGHHHQEEEGDDLLVGQLVAVDLGVDQCRGQVVADASVRRSSTMSW